MGSLLGERNAYEEHRDKPEDQFYATGLDEFLIAGKLSLLKMVTEYVHNQGCKRKPAAAKSDGERRSRGNWKRSELFFLTNWRN